MGLLHSKELPCKFFEHDSTHLVVSERVLVHCFQVFICVYLKRVVVFFIGISRRRSMFTALSHITASQFTMMNYIFFSAALLFQRNLRLNIFISSTLFWNICALMEKRITLNHTISDEWHKCMRYTTLHQPVCAWDRNHHVELKQSYN